METPFQELIFDVEFALRERVDAGASAQVGRSSA
jgi:uncharacterized protein YggL (DUF469 family)